MRRNVAERRPICANQREAALRIVLYFVSLLVALVQPAAAQDLIPWRQGAVAPKGDAGFWWMAAEGGFAKQ